MKPDGYQDASGRARRHERTEPALTQRDLSCESGAEVSRGHSSDRGPAKAGSSEGPKNSKQSSMPSLAEAREELFSVLKRIFSRELFTALRGGFHKGQHPGSVLLLVASMQIGIVGLAGLSHPPEDFQ